MCVTMAAAAVAGRTCGGGNMRQDKDELGQIKCVRLLNFKCK